MNMMRGMVFILAGIITSSSVYAQDINSRGIIEEVGHLLFDGVGITDVWYWSDPVTTSEYAIVGWHGGQGTSDGGFYLVNFDDPTQPAITSQVFSGNGFDLKVWKNYVYAVNGSSGTASITDISNPANPVEAGSFPSAHNIFIDHKGFLFAESPGVRIYDLNVNPTNPTLVWAGGVEGHDCLVIDDLLFSFHGSVGTFIYDISDRTSPVLLSRIQDPTITYAHSGWLTEDGRYLFITDELAQHPAADITVWDLIDIANPVKIAAVAYATATIHNLMILGDLAYISFYNDGFRVLDVSNPFYPAWMGEVDINGDVQSGEGYSGAWGVYPFTNSGIVLVSGRTVEGGALYLFNAKKPVVSNEENEGLPASLAISDIYPNPFNNHLNISFSLPVAGNVEVDVFDILGRLVESVYSESMPAGSHVLSWQLNSASGNAVPAGAYIVRLRSETGQTSKLINRLR